MTKTQIFNKGMRLLKQKSPIILAGVAIVGVGVSIYLAIDCDRKARRKLDEERKNEKEKDENFDDFSNVEKVKKTWTCYAPVAAVGGITIASIVMSKHIDMKRQAALMALYTAMEKDRDTILEKANEMFGKNKTRELKDEVAKEKLRKHEESGKSVVFHTGTGEMLCYDAYSGREFYSDRNTIESIRNDINDRLIRDQEEYVALNEYYEEVGLEPVKGGHELGWDRDNLMELDYSSHLSAEGRPAMVVDYNCGPIWEWQGRHHYR